MGPHDITLPCGNGLVSLRVGAVILRNGLFLLAGNNFNDYLYSVGGRIRFGETAEQAIIREVEEETGVKLEIDRLGFVHENYFMGDVPGTFGKPVYEICFYFYMKVPEDFSLKREAFQEGSNTEYLEWVPFDTEKTIYPEFFKTELKNPSRETKHIVADERISK